MFSMTFLSSAERLTIVVSRARNLRLNDDAKNVPSQSSISFHYHRRRSSVNFGGKTFSNRKYNEKLTIYVIFARKMFSHFWRGGANAPYPVSYAYVQVMVNTSSTV